MKNLKDLEAQYKKLGKEIEKLKAEPQPQPPFWAWFGLESHKLQRVIKIENDQALVDQDNSDMRLEDLNWCGSWSMMRFFIRLATPDEIKEHLVKLAKEKGFKPKCHIRLLNNTGTAILDGTPFNYYAEIDELCLGGWVIYRKGKWAEIVPSLPSFEELLKGGILRWARLRQWSPKAAMLVMLELVADYVNEGWELDWEDGGQIKHRLSYAFRTNEWSAYSNSLFSHSPVHFKSSEARDKAIEIFRHNGAEQELINFYK